MLSPTAASPLTQVDAFVSHSWGDDGTCKMAALRDWASEFEAAHGRRPTVWLANLEAEYVFMYPN